MTASAIKSKMSEVSLFSAGSGTAAYKMHLAPVFTGFFVGALASSIHLIVNPYFKTYLMPPKEYPSLRIAAKITLWSAENIAAALIANAIGLTIAVKTALLIALISYIALKILSFIYRSLATLANYLITNISGFIDPKDNKFSNNSRI